MAKMNMFGGEGVAQLEEEPWDAGETQTGQLVSMRKVRISR